MGLCITYNIDRGRIGSNQSSYEAGCWLSMSSNVSRINFDFEFYSVRDLNSSFMDILKFHMNMTSFYSRKRSKYFLSNSLIINSQPSVNIEL